MSEHCLLFSNMKCQISLHLSETYLWRLNADFLKNEQVIALSKRLSEETDQLKRYQQSYVKVLFLKKEIF